MSEITKRALSASLKKLLGSKPLSKITVSDITADCGVNRQTFYYHKVPICTRGKNLDGS
jgi:AcrR family transcriptional regulator